MKNFLLVMVLLLGVVSQVSAAPSVDNSQQQAELKQKACQNIFSFINIDMSFMSPRAAVSDVSVSDVKPADLNKKDPVVPIVNKKDLPCNCAKPCACEKDSVAKDKNGKTSLFRIDLLHLFKIQVL